MPSIETGLPSNTNTLKAIQYAVEELRRISSKQIDQNEQLIEAVKEVTDL